MPVTFSGVDLRGTTAFSVTEGFSPYALFASGEQGAWYDPSDMSTMFQDAAGNTRVTAVEQPVGRILDKSGRGNHATQSTSASRPVLSARYNLLTYSEDFSNAAWVPGNACTVISTTETDPNGGSTAAKLTMGLGCQFYQAITNYVSSVTGTFTVYVKKPATGGATHVRLFTNNTTGWNTGAATKIALTSSWQQATLTGALSNSTSAGIQIGGKDVAGNSDADCVGDVLIAFADVRLLNLTTVPSYQKVTSSSNYSLNGFPYFLRFDGVDDGLSTASIDFSGTDKVTICAGAGKLKDTSYPCVIELSANINTNNGAFNLFATDGNIDGSAAWVCQSKGTTGRFAATGTTYEAPRTNVLTGIGNISGDSVIIRANGTQQGSSTADQGTGNYGNYSMYIGRRGGTTFAFTGAIYGIVVRGVSSTSGEITDLEGWMNGRTRAY